MPLTPAERDALILHIAFGLVCALALAAPLPMPSGWRILVLVVLYNVALPSVAQWRGHAEWLNVWRFLVPLSALLILPDAFLAVQLQTLVFPDLDGVPRLLEVPIYMGGMWTIPLFGVLMVGLGVAARRGERIAAWWVLLTSFITFFGAETLLPLISLYYPTRVQLLFGAAVYVSPPITLLGLQTFWAYLWARAKPWPHQLAAALAVMVVYLGGLALAYLLIERSG